MSKKILKTIFATAMLFPLAVFANGGGSYVPQEQPQPMQAQPQPSCSDSSSCGNYKETMPPYSCHSFNSGFYLGIQGSYVFTIDDAEFQGTNPSNPEYLPKDQTNHLSSYGASAYFGYGHVFDHGFLPYLGGELALNLRSDYNESNASFDDGDLYNAQINSNGGISFDITPGFFFDDTQTTLVYLRLGIEGARFQIDSDTGDINEDYQYRPLFRAGAGIEHEIVNNFYIRADYVFSAMVDSLDYSPYLPTYNNMYSSQSYFNTFSVGITYRF